MAKAQRIPRPDEPNVVIPLATSYNERGITGFTHSVTNSEDQRKVNCFYELAKNPMTGKGTLTLSKRPGTAVVSPDYGSSSQSSYLLIANSIGTIVVFSTISSDADLTASIPGQTTTLASATGGSLPRFVDKTKISGLEYIVLQTSGPGAGGRTFYSSDVTNVTWAEITDADFTGLVKLGKMEHIDGFAFIMDSSNVIYNSDTNSLANWTGAAGSDKITKGIRQDIPVGLARLKNQLLSFGENSVEMFYNAGNTTGSPLGRIPQLSQDIGLLSTVGRGTNYYATIGDKLYFVGVKGGAIGIYVYDGSNFDKVSSNYIDKILDEESVSLFSVNALGFQGQQAISIDFSSPVVAAHRWLMFFPEWKEWFEWTSDIFSPTNSGFVASATGPWFLGTSSGKKNKIYSFSSVDNWQDAGTSYQWFTQFKHPGKNSLNFMPMFGVDADTDTTTNDLTVEASDNDCVTFSTIGTIDQTQDRKMAFRGGSFRKRFIRLGNTNARPSRIHNWLARIE